LELNLTRPSQKEDSVLERLSSTARRVRRGRPITFAYTRPLSPQDLSGMTGLLADEVEVAPAVAPGAERSRKSLGAWLLGLFGR
jgi:hypothetical protein